MNELVAAVNVIAPLKVALAEVARMPPETVIVLALLAPATNEPLAPTRIFPEPALVAPEERTVPLLTVMPPEKLFAALRKRTPVLSLVLLFGPRVTTPFRVGVLALRVMMELAARVLARERARLLEPLRVKFPPICRRFVRLT